MEQNLGPQFRSRAIVRTAGGTETFYENGQVVAPGSFQIRQPPSFKKGNRGNLMAQMHDRSATLADAAATAAGYADDYPDDRYSDYEPDYDDDDYDDDY